MTFGNTFERQSPSGEITVTWNDGWHHVEITDSSADRGLVAINNTELDWLVMVLSELSLVQMRRSAR
jgi:hypothetical protein